VKKHYAGPAKYHAALARYFSLPAQNCGAPEKYFLLRPSFPLFQKNIEKWSGQDKNPVHNQKKSGLSKIGKDGSITGQDKRWN
jgi:hypothetical protein